MQTIKTIILSLALCATGTATLQAGKLHYLITTNDIDGINKLLENPNVDVNEEDDCKFTPLISACFVNKPNIEVIKLLIQKGAKLNLQDKWGGTALIRACESNTTKKPNLAIIKLLIDKGANINLKETTFNDSALTTICNAKYPDIEVIKLLIDKGANINKKGCYEETPLISACNTKTPNSAIIKLLINNGADLNLQDEIGNTALHWSCYNNCAYPADHRANTENIVLLIQRGAKLNIQSKEGDTALMKICAGWSPDIRILKFLILNGADLNIKNKKGNTALLIACKSYMTQIPLVKEAIKLLIQNGANLNLKNEDGETALKLECLKKAPDIEIVKLLIQHGADLTIPSWYGNSALENIKEWTPEQRTELFEALTPLKSNINNNIKGFIGYCHEGIIEKFQQNIVPPLLDKNDKLYGSTLQDAKDIIELLHAHIKLSFGQKTKNLFPNHIPNDGLSVTMQMLDKKLFLKTLEKIITEQYFSAHKDMSLRKINTFKILGRFAKAMSEKQKNKRTRDGSPSSLYAYTKFQDIGICFK